MKTILIFIILIFAVSCTTVTPIVSTSIPNTITPDKTSTMTQTLTPVSTPTFTRTATKTNTPTFTPTITLTSTNTPFPTPTRIVLTANGITGVSFGLSRNPAIYHANEDIWFHFKVTNFTDKNIQYAGIGAVIDDNFSQPSWGDEILKAGQTLEWDDHINYWKVGKYKIYLALCWLSNRGQCERAIDRNGWEWLSSGLDLEIIP